MLLNKKFLTFGILFLLLLSSVGYAQVCEVDRIKDVLKKILFLYYTEPASVPLTKDEVKDMLVFYLSISDQTATVDCSAFGSRSNKPISDVVNKGKDVVDKIPSCPDETKYGECSKFRPAYCYAGAIYQKCDLCGCPTNSVCGKSGKCEATTQNVTCSKDIDCAQSSSIGGYYCVNNYIYKDYINYTCINSGTAISKCVAVNGTYVLAYCNPILNQSCVAGQSYCKVRVINNSTNTNQTTNQSNQTFSGIVTIKGRIIDYFTKQPIANGLIFTWDSQTVRRDTYTNSNGEFSTTADTTQVTITTPKSFGIQPKCYNNMGMGVFRNSDNSLSVNVNINSLIGAAKYFAVTGSEVNVGDIPMWPAVDIQIDSDTYVKFNLEYNGLTGAGNSLYKIFHYLSDTFPLTVDTRVKLTDQANNIYYSPYMNLPLSNGCQRVGLAFYNKQFSWNASATQTNATNQTTLLAPYAIRAGWGITNDNTKKSSLFFHAINFGYNDPVPSAFRVYLKKPGESVFSRTAEFKNLSAPCLTITTTGGSILSTGWLIYRRCNGNDWKIDSYWLPTTGYPQGVYRFYLAAVDGSGQESTSPEFEMYNLQPLTVLSPTTAQSPVASAPTFQWTSPSGWPTSPASYFVSIYDDANFGEPWIIHSKLVSAPSSTTASYLYDGPALDPAKKYIVRIYGLYRAATTTICPSCDYISMDASTQTFWISGNQTTNQTGSKNYGESCTTGTQCTSGYCVSMPLNNSVGTCAYYGGDMSITYSTCAQGYYPSTPCQCGGVAIHAGACNNGIFYWPSTQSGSDVGAYCTDGNTQCKTGICFLNLCSYAVKCTSQTPGYCYTQTECTAAGATWCTNTGCTSGTC